MKFVRDLGIGQCVVPPPLRPNLTFLREIGFVGDDARVIQQTYKTDPTLLAISYSASSMWTANAATVSPSADCKDGRLHLTPANLASNLHRAIECASTSRILRSIFADPSFFEVHPALPSVMALSDEGAANHTRLCREFGSSGVELFVYGSHFLDAASPKPRKFPARQTLQACQAVARRHGLGASSMLFVQQSPEAIDSGVFHNDVISVGNQNVLLCHQRAFVDQQQVLFEIRKSFEQTCDAELYVIEFSDDEISLEDAVASYLFNSQLLTRSDGKMSLVCPGECESTPTAKRCTERILAELNPVDQIHFLDLRQSMNNGGGPACLRLRVVLTDQQQSAMHQGVVLTDALYNQLVQWVDRHYRESLPPDDLRDPQLAVESRAAAEELAGILRLPGP